MTIFYSDVVPLSKYYSPITLHLSPSTRFLNENPDEPNCQISVSLMRQGKLYELVQCRRGPLYDSLATSNQCCMTVMT